MIWSQGGYALDAISECALSVVRTLNGDPPERLSIRGPPSQIAINDIRNVLKWHAQYWTCLSEYREPGMWASWISGSVVYGADKSMADLSELEAEPLNSKDPVELLLRYADEADVIRYYQKEVLAKEHDILAPCILNKDLSKIFAQKIINT